MSNSVRLTATVLTLAALTACVQEPEYPPATSELAPAELVMATAGTRYVSKNMVDGLEETSVVLTVANGIRVTQNETTGCKWARGLDSPFSPATMWENCDGYTGSRQIVSSEGALFPLQVGNTQSWSSKGTNDKGETWEDSRSCTVQGTASVTVPAGAFDTFHVRCTGENRIRHYYYAPEVGRSVLYRDRHLRRNEERHLQSISYTPGA